MNQIFLIPFVFFFLLITVDAEQLYRCVDSKGNNVITSIPQDGMECSTGESNSEPKASKRKNVSSENLFDICNNLYRESEEISNEIKSFDPRLSELQREQFDIKQKNMGYNWTELEESKNVRDEQYKINQKISLLYQKKSLIENDIRMYKCDQLRRDLSESNKGNVTIGNSPFKKNTFIYRNGRSSIIIRN